MLHGCMDDHRHASAAARPHWALRQRQACNSNWSQRRATQLVFTITITITQPSSCRVCTAALLGQRQSHNMVACACARGVGVHAAAQRSASQRRLRAASDGRRMDVDVAGPLRRLLVERARHHTAQQAPRHGVCVLLRV